MTEAIYLEVTEKTEAAKKAGRRVSVSGMLKFLGVSRSGYLAWLHHVPSDTEKRREAVKAKIQDIYDDSKQNYGAPKITVELRKTGEVISERTVGTYMRQMGIRAQWSKPWTITTKDSDFSTELQNILDACGRSGKISSLTCLMKTMRKMRESSLRHTGKRCWPGQKFSGRKSFLTMT